VITLEALTKRYGETRAVDASDLTVSAGRITGFLGDSIQYGVAVVS
jgi:ABC-2 type transport system ATP-binding protein